VLLRSVADGPALTTWATETFATADAVDEATGRYLGLVAGARAEGHRTVEAHRGGWLTVVAGVPPLGRRAGRTGQCGARGAGRGEVGRGAGFGGSRLGELVDGDSGAHDDGGGGAAPPKRSSTTSPPTSAPASR